MIEKFKVLVSYFIFWCDVVGEGMLYFVCGILFVVVDFVEE